MLVALGIVELKDGKHQEAIDYFVQALAIRTKLCEIICFYGYCAPPR